LERQHGRVLVSRSIDYEAAAFSTVASRAIGAAGFLSPGLQGKIAAKA
jgi:hypothetical protein